RVHFRPAATRFGLRLRGFGHPAAVLDRIEQGVAQSGRRIVEEHVLAIGLVDELRDPAGAGGEERDAERQSLVDRARPVVERRRHRAESAGWHSAARTYAPGARSRAPRPNRASSDWGST